MPARTKHTVRGRGCSPPRNFVFAMLQSMERLGYDPSALLNEAGISIDIRSLATDKEASLSLDEFSRFNRYCNESIRDYIRRVDGGSSMSEEQFEFLCYAIINCSTLREVIERTQRFFSMFDGKISEISLEVKNSTAELVVSPTRKVWNEAAFSVDIYGFAVLHMLFCWLIDENFSVSRVEVVYPEQSNVDLYMTLFDCPLSFGKPRNLICFDAAYLDSPVVRDYAELTDLLDAFPFDMMLKSYRSKPLADQVYLVVTNAYRTNREFPNMDQLGDTFGLSSITLRRRLQEEGTSYSDIRQRCRVNIAIESLKKMDLTIDAVAQLSGFSDASTFRRAFKKWTGTSPTLYRKELSDGLHQS